MKIMLSIKIMYVNICTEKIKEEQVKVVIMFTIITICLMNKYLKYKFNIFKCIVII